MGAIVRCLDFQAGIRHLEKEDTVVINMLHLEY